MVRQVSALFLVHISDGEVKRRDPHVAPLVTSSLLGLRREGNLGADIAEGMSGSTAFKKTTLDILVMSMSIVHPDLNRSPRTPVFQVP